MSYINDSFADSSDSELYSPDFSLLRKETGKTTRRTFSSELKNPTLEIERYSDENDMIPITNVDDLIEDFGIYTGTTEMILRKENSFANVKDALELYSTKVTKTYDSKSNLEKHIYTVPVVKYIKNQNPPHQKSFQSKTKNLDTPFDFRKKEEFIIIGDNKYSCDKIYKPHGGMFIPFVPIVPDTYKIGIPDKTQYHRVEKSSFVKNVFTIAFPFATKISGFAMSAEAFKYENVHSTTFHCHRLCTRPNHLIRVLSNNPGFIKTFCFSFRSPDTRGKWIDMGKFDGMKSLFSRELISFDEILIKEFRISVVDYEGNINRIRIEPFGKMISPEAIDSSTIEYTLYTPRDGHYLRRFEKRAVFVRGRSGKCDCSMCRPRGSKGLYKEKCQTMYQMCQPTNDV